MTGSARRSRTPRCACSRASRARTGSRSSSPRSSSAARRSTPWAIPIPTTRARPAWPPTPCSSAPSAARGGTTARCGPRWASSSSARRCRRSRTSAPSAAGGAASVSPLRPELVEGLDLLIVRELTGGLYFGERGHDEHGAFDTLSYSVDEITRILRRASGSRSSRRGQPDERRQGERARYVPTLASRSPTSCRAEYPDVGSTTSSSTR